MFSLPARSALLPGSGSRHQRRLSDKILAAFHSACDTNQLCVAQDLLLVLDHMLRRPTPPGVDRRNVVQSTVTAHERLWRLRHPEAQVVGSVEVQDTDAGLTIQSLDAL